MKNEERKIADNHRRINEVGGLVMGIGLGLILATRVNVLIIFGIPLVLIGFITLYYEQNKWNKLKE